MNDTESTYVKIKVLFFASLREQLGPMMSIDWTSDDQSLTVGRLRQHLQMLTAHQSVVLGIEQGVRCAVNQQLASETTFIQPHDEIAFFPPVTGG